MTTLEVLKQYFGYDTYRGGQEALINDVLAGRDVLGIMPTGAGKSICFQVPALMLDGLTLVVSPLISLMRDQVNALMQSGVKAAFINSSLSERQIYKALDNAKNGAYKLMYIAPERLLSPDFLSFAHSVKISMLTVDEAHCISQWGQDFRPSYAKVPDFIGSLPKRPTLSAFTATATPKVREDIVKLLGLQDPTVLVTGFNRRNLYFGVQKPKNKFSALTAFLSDKKDRSGIVYCSTRAAVEEVCDRLKAEGYNASRYHAGLSDRERHENQDDFLYDRVQIMAATNAFGMGIDKSNVSFVVHYNMPKDIESYYQEAGRAGRDGEPADCILLYSAQDVRTNLWLIDNARDTEYPDIKTEEILRERERKRLREMTFYCATNDCLRGYILKYFGENPPDFCGNCGSCNTNFETVDVTVEAQKIISCIVRMKEQYGLKMVIDVLRGSKNERVLRFGLDKLTTYGISDKTDKQLREIINHLLLAEHLIKTDDQYPILILGPRADEVLRGGAKVQVKLSKDTELSSPKAGQGDKKKYSVRTIDKRLFSILRELRHNIANEQNVPAFVIFSDSTLTDMCIKTPTTSEEFLEVSGVGRVKLERYGNQFLKAITEFVGDNYIPDTQLKTAKPFDASEVEITDESVTVSTIADRINCVLLESGYDKVNGRSVNDWLVSEGYMILITESNTSYKIPTDAGAELGIHFEERVIRGRAATVNLFGPAAQSFIVQNALKIISYKN